MPAREIESRPIYEEKLDASYPLVIGVLVFSLLVGIIPGIIVGGLSWLTALYFILALGVVVSFFRVKIELYADKLKVKYGLFYRKTIDVQSIKGCSDYRVLHPIRMYGGWGIRSGRDGTYALTQAFVNDGVKLETAGKTFVVSSRSPENFCAAIKSG